MSNMKLRLARLFCKSWLSVFAQVTLKVIFPVGFFSGLACVLGTMIGPGFSIWAAAAIWLGAFIVVIGFVSLLGCLMAIGIQTKRIQDEARQTLPTSLP